MHSNSEIDIHKHFSEESSFRVSEALKKAQTILREKGLENPETDSEILLRGLLGIDRAKLYASPERKLSAKEFEIYNKLIKRRTYREPSQYILGTQEFWSMDFMVNRSVLIPRPETEILIEKAVELANKRTVNKSHLNILDIGTGTGNIAVSIAKELKSARIIATDISAGALEVAKVNAERNGVADRIKFVQGSIFSLFAKDSKFDFIVSNPPYIPLDEIDKLSPEVSKWEPRIALDGGEDGLYFYKKIISRAFNYLKDKGVLLLEIGEEQAGQIREIAKSYKEYDNIKIHRDYSGKNRMAEIWIK